MQGLIKNEVFNVTSKHIFREQMVAGKLLSKSCPGCGAPGQPGEEKCATVCRKNSQRMHSDRRGKFEVCGCKYKDKDKEKKNRNTHTVQRKTQNKFLR